MKKQIFDYSKLEESRIIQEIESYRSIENFEIAEDNFKENRVRQQFKQFLKDSGII